MSLVKVASLQGQGSPVTAIAALEPSFGNAIIYGSQDKSFRVCKRHEGDEPEKSVENDIMSEYLRGEDQEIM